MSSQPPAGVQAPAMRGFTAALLAAVLILAAGFQWLTAPLASPLEPPLESWHAASLAGKSAALRWAAPLAGTPFVRGLPPHAWLTAPLPQPLHAGADAWRLLAVALAGAFAAVVALALRAAGCHPLAAGAAAVALPLAGIFRGDPFMSVESALAATLLGGTWLAALRFRAGGSWRLAAAAIVLLALAVDSRLSWLPLALPAWVALDRPALPRPQRLALGGALLAALLVGGGHAVASAWLTLIAGSAGPGQPAVSPGPGDVFRLAVLGLTSAGHAASPRVAIGSVARVAHAVFGLPGLALMLLGLSRLGSRRAMLAAGVSSAMLLAVAITSGPVEASPAALALLLGASLGVALGAHCLLQAPTWQSRSGAALLVVVVAALPAARFHPAEAWSSARSLEVSRDALASALGPRAAFVADLPPIDRAVLPLVRGERVIPRPETVRRLAATGYTVYAFERARRELEAHGLLFARVPLACSSLDAYLSALPAGAVVAVAASPNSPGAIPYSHPAGASAIGAPRRADAWLAHAVCLLGVAGASSGAIEAVEQESADLQVPANSRVAGRQIVPATVSLSAGPDGARVAERRWHVESRKGLVIAVLDGTGNLWDERVVDETTGFTLAPPDGRFAASRAEAADTACVVIPDGVTADVTALGRSGALGWSADTLSGGSLVVYGFAPTGLAPRSPDEDGRLTIEAFAGDDRGLAARMSADRVPLPAGMRLPASRLRLALAGRPAWGTVALGAVPSMMLATARDTGGRSVRLCSAGIGAEVLFADAAQGAADLLSGRNPDVRLGVGWYPREFDGQTPFHWTGEQAVLLLRMARVSALRVTIDATAAVQSVPPVLVTLAVNGQVSAPCSLTRDPTRCEWVVGDGAWVEGLNQIGLRVSRAAQVGADPRWLGIAVRGVRLERLE